jgi:hypothetical protein
MRYIFALIAFSLILGACGNEKSSNPRSDNTTVSGDMGKPKIVFEKTLHDFGQVKQGEKVGWFFKYKNEGNSDLIIKKASASCGCTIPDYDKRPLPPGEEASLKVIYDSSGRSGLELKTITIQSNAENSVTTLKLKVEVIN